MSETLSRNQTALVELYGERRDEMLSYVADCSERGYPIEAEPWISQCQIGFEVIMTGDSLAHFGTLQDIARGANDNWFLRDVTTMTDHRVKLQFAVDVDGDLLRSMSR